VGKPAVPSTRGRCRWRIEVLGRISRLRRVRLGNPLGHGNFLSGLKLSGERGGGLGLARFSAVCPLGGHMHANGLLWYAYMAGGRCCMYGPNYVKLSRVFAVQLFSMFSGHYTAYRAAPGPIRPPLAIGHWPLAGPGPTAEPRPPRPADPAACIAALPATAEVKGIFAAARGRYFSLRTSSVSAPCGPAVTRGRRA
jgi:hypothetical protein